MTEEENRRWLEEEAADMGGVTADELARMQRWDDLLIVELGFRYTLEGREGLRVLNRATEKLDLLAEAALYPELFGDDPAMKMLLRDASERARTMRERLRAEIEEGERTVTAERRST